MLLLLVSLLNGRGHAAVPEKPAPAGGYERVLKYRAYEVEVRVDAAEPKSQGSYELAVFKDGGLIARLNGDRRGVLESSWIDELNGSGGFDLTLVFRSLESVRPAEIMVYEWSDDLYLLPLKLQPLSAAQRLGYRGYDEYRVEDGVLYHEFPRFPNDDPQAAPTGATARFRYDFANDRWIGIP